MAYGKAKILLCATCMTERRPVLASPYFLDSLEAGYKTDPTTIVNTLHSDYRLELEVVLSQYFDKVLGCKGAGGLAKPLPLKYCGSTESPQPAPSSGDGSCYGDVRPQQQLSPA